MIIPGLTPRSRRAATRRQRVAHEKRMENITRNLGEYAFIKEQSRLNRASEERIAKMDAEHRRLEEKVRKFGERVERENDELRAELEKMAGEDPFITDDDDALDFDGDD